MEQYKILCSLSRRRDEDFWYSPSDKVPPLKSDVKAEEEKPEIPDETPKRPRGLDGQEIDEKAEPEPLKQVRGYGLAGYIDLEMVPWMWVKIMLAIILWVIAVCFCDTLMPLYQELTLIG